MPRITLTREELQYLVTRSAWDHDDSKAGWVTPMPESLARKVDKVRGTITPLPC